MSKNIPIFILALACFALAYGQISTQKQYDSAPISAADYGGLIALRDLISPEDYQSIVLPYLEKARSGGKMTRAELEELSAKLEGLNHKAFEAAQKTRPQDALAQALDETLRSATDLGTDISRGVRDTLDDLSRRLDDAIRSVPSLPSPAPSPSSPEGSQAPAQI